MKQFIRNSLLILLVLLICLTVRAQNKKITTVGVGVNFIQFNQSGERSVKYSINLNRQIRSTNNELEGRIGFIHLPANEISFPDLYDGTKSFERSTYSSDFAFVHGIKMNSSHILRVVLGPSLWFFKNVALQPVIKVATTNGIVLATTIVEETVNETAFGYNLLTDYKLVSKSHFSLLLRAGYVHLSKSKSNLFTGLLIGYQL